MMHAPECVLLKRRGVEYVRQLTAGMSVQEQLEFWRKRTDAMLEGQKKAQQNIEEEARNRILVQSAVCISRRAYQKRTRPFPKKEIPDSNKEPSFSHPEIACS